MRSGWLTMLILAAPLPVWAQHRAADGPKLEHFEKRIRPVLLEHCYPCHSADAQHLRGGLRVDSRAGLLRGGDSGPALVVGDAQASLLIAALRYEDFEMPPRGKLPAEVIADFERWIQDGALDPRQGESPERNERPPADVEVGRSHWAYQPQSKPALPAVRDRDWPANEIDFFVLSQLEAQGLRPAHAAAPAVLARRLYFDLIGLPPTPAQLKAFIDDRSSAAVERVVDQLLASPRFGERWGRHWLDIVRFAESLTLRGFILKEAWRYRDYVVQAFNEDLPYDRFVIEQLAGDLLPSEHASLQQLQRRLIATTFLMLGNTNLEDQDKKQLEMDFIDEQLDVIGKGLLAQTITCARCHDHKFDPIPTSDYYAMAGILSNVTALEHANVSKWTEVALPVEPAMDESLRKSADTIAATEGQIKQLKAQISAAPGDGGIVSAEQLVGIVVDDVAARRVGQWKHSTHTKPFVGEGYLHDGDDDKGRKTLTFAPAIPSDGLYEVRLAYTPGSNRAARVPVTVFSADGEKTVYVNEQQRPPVEGLSVALGQFRFEAQGQSFVIVATEGTHGHVVADAVQWIRAAADGTESAPTSVAVDDSRAQRLQQEIELLERELKQLRDAAPSRPMVMSVVEKKEHADLRLHIRGSVHQLGSVAPRGVLRATTIGDAPAMPHHQSGRLELARWLVNPQNPLATRVIVNRLWHWLFGAGLVRTVDNFGTTGERPSHPALLEYLAADFWRHGGSIKHLVREIVLSRAYQMSVQADPLATSADPENRWLARMNRKRLDAECLRDAMLSASGDLKLDVGGRSFPESLSSDYGFQYRDTRRSVYAPVFRNSLPDLLEAFDFANPSLVTGRRSVSTVAPQALFLMNHPFVIEQAEGVARRLLRDRPRDDGRRVRLAFNLALGRSPTADEMDLSLQFVRAWKSHADDSPQQSGAELRAWTLLTQSLLSSIGFRYLE